MDVVASIRAPLRVLGMLGEHLCGHMGSVEVIWCALGGACGAFGELWGSFGVLWGSFGVLWGTRAPPRESKGSEKVPKFLKEAKRKSR